MFLLLFILPSCGTIKALDLGTEEKIEHTETSKQIGQTEIFYLRKEISELSEKLKNESLKKKELQSINEQLRNKIRILSSTTMKKVEVKNHPKIEQPRKKPSVKKTIQKIQKPQRDLKVGINQILAKKQTTVKSDNDKKSKSPFVRIKVLSGTGSLDSAKVLSKKVQNYGLDVEVIDLASRENFQETTVYYAPNYDGVAAELAGELGEHSIVKAISWNSVYDIIIVSGQAQ